MAHQQERVLQAARVDPAVIIQVAQQVEVSLGKVANLAVLQVGKVKVQVGWVTHLLKVNPPPAINPNKVVAKVQIRVACKRHT
jgi:hypothetical protein